MPATVKQPNSKEQAGQLRMHGITGHCEDGRPRKRRKEQI
jgi:hypothetical protein